ncbi:MAG TPA: hypothetical protein VKX16_10490 [Chloroflexota bacterium]|nr:hypothetical protein [Chloroflexota bacterium]
MASDGRTQQISDGRAVQGNSLIRLIASGLHDAQIAQLLPFNASAVKRRIERIMHEWHPSTRPKPAVWTVLQGLVDPWEAIIGERDSPGVRAIMGWMRR